MLSCNFVKVCDGKAYTNFCIKSESDVSQAYCAYNKVAVCIQPVYALYGVRNRVFTIL